MNWVKQKLQEARELAAKPVEWAKENKHKPVEYYLKARLFLDEAVKKAEEERDENRKDS